MEWPWATTERQHFQRAFFLPGVICWVYMGRVSFVRLPASGTDSAAVSGIWYGKYTSELKQSSSIYTVMCCVSDETIKDQTSDKGFCLQELPVLIPRALWCVAHCSCPLSQRAPKACQSRASWEDFSSQLSCPWSNGKWTPVFFLQQRFACFETGLWRDFWCPAWNIEQHLNRHTELDIHCNVLRCKHAFA